MEQKASPRRRRALEGTTATVQSSAQPPPLPRYMSIPAWEHLTDMSRSATYVELSRGNLKAKKNGNRTVIDVAVGLAWIASLPDAQIGKKRAAGE